MKNLKHIRDFLNENSDEYEILKSKLIKIVDLFKGSFRNTYFLRTGKDEFQEFLEECEQDNFDVDYFMSNYISKAIQDNDLVYHSAIMDMLLYKYDKKHPLSGALLTDDIGSWDDNGAIIKYNYNYHKLDLGKKYLYQSYDNLSEFYKESANQFPLSFMQRHIDFKIKLESEKLFSPKSNIIEYYSDVVNFKNYYASIINLKGLCQDNYIHSSYDNLLNNIDYDPTVNTYHHIVEGCFIAYFGENIGKKLEVWDVDDALERMEIKQTTQKYNL